MNRERRHELEKNVLASHLERYLVWWQPHLKWVAAGILVVLVALGANAFITQQNESRKAAAWEEFLQASLSMDRRKALEDVAAVHDGLPAAVWALQSKADMDLQQGTRLIYENRSEAEQLLESAIAGFQEVIDVAKTQTFLTQRSQFGIAMALETMGEIRKAREAYESVISQGESTALGTMAQERLERLQAERTQQFYAWLADQQDAPSSSGALNLPRDLGDLPDLPDFNLSPDFSFPGLDGPENAPPADLPSTDKPSESLLDPESVPPTEDADVTPPVEPATPEVPPESQPPLDSPPSEANAPDSEVSPEEPGTEEPGTEELGTEEPGTEEPGTEEPGTEEPGTEEPGEASSEEVSDADNNS